jgi:hypothetical protein
VTFAALSCPRCGGADKEIIGVEIRGVYDGVLYWECGVCNHAWNRWPVEHALFDLAAIHLARLEAARAEA